MVVRNNHLIFVSNNKTNTMRNQLDYNQFNAEIKNRTHLNLSTSQTEMAYRCYTRLGFDVLQCASIASTLKK